MKVSMFYFGRKRKPPVCSFLVCVWCFSPSVLVLIDGVKMLIMSSFGNAASGGLWLAEKHLISGYFMNSHGLYMYKKILLRSRSRICALLGASQTWWLPELSVEAKLEYTVVKISVVTNNGCMIMYLQLMNATAWAHAACMRGDSDSLLAPRKRAQRIFLSCRLLQLWNPSQS